MDIDHQADFLLAAFDVWYGLDCPIHDPGRRALALAAFSAGVLATDSLLSRITEEHATEADG